MLKSDKLAPLRRIYGYVLRNLFGTITHVKTNRNVVALTFDDGPDPEITTRLLEILKKHEAKATFFMTGKNAKRYPHIVKQVYQAQHAIGNHSWDHASFPLITGQQRRAEIRSCEKAIAPYGRRLFRPPFGHQTLATRLDALLLRYKVVTWNLLAEDWLDHDAGWMVANLVKNVHAGSIVLLHDRLYHTYEDRYRDREPMLDAVSILLKKLSSRFLFVTVPKLLQQGCPQRQYWYHKGSTDWQNTLKTPEY